MSYARTRLKGVMFYDSRRAYKGLTLITPTEGKGVWLIDMTGRPVNHWELPLDPGCGAELLPNGNLLYSGKVPNPLDNIDGAGGALMELDWDGNLLWEYKDPYLHHKAERMKNGNTLTLKWVKLPTQIAAQTKGGDPGTEHEGVMWGDAIQEITADGKVVWEWIAHEHVDPKVTLRCPICPRDTWAHVNFVRELPDGNILASMMKLNIIVIIEKASGDIKWQWGKGELSHQHYVTVLDNGNVLVFDDGMHPNGFSVATSRILEVSPALDKVVWAYSGEEVACIFYSVSLGNCQRLPNGNTLITEGITGRIIEVNGLLDMVWEFSNNLLSYKPYPAQTRSHMVYSAYRYGMDYSGLKDPVSWPSEKQAAPGTQALTEEIEEAKLKARLAHLGY